MINETKVGSDTTLIVPPGFQLFNVPRPKVNPRLHKTHKNYGGVAIMVADSIATNVKVWKSCPDLGYIWLHLPGMAKDGKDLFIAT